MSLHSTVTEYMVYAVLSLEIDEWRSFVVFLKKENC